MLVSLDLLRLAKRQAGALSLTIPAKPPGSTFTRAIFAQTNWLGHISTGRITLPQARRSCRIIGTLRTPRLAY